MYLRNLEEKGEEKARKRFILDVITFFNYSTIRGRKPLEWNPIPTVMFKSYLLSAVRSLIFQKEYTIINILGLALGLCCLMLIALYGKEELSFDMFHTQADKIYRVVEKIEGTDEEARFFAATRDPVGSTLVKDFPQFSESTTMVQFGQAVITVGDSSDLRQFNERNYLITDEYFLSIFDFELIEGDRASCLSEPGQIILTESTARKYFGQEDPMGKRVSFNRSGELQVTGILKDPPSNSHIQFDFALSVSTLLGNEQIRNMFYSWGNNRIFRYEYVLADAPLDLERFQDQMSSFEAKYRSEPDRAYQLQAMKDVHFESENMEFDLLSSTDTQRSRTYLTLFAWLAFIVLIVAGINYVNLATARSVKRSKEIGIRKVIGAHKGQIIFQFLMESVLTAFLALALAGGLTFVLLKPFNEVARKAFDWMMLLEWDILLFVLMGTLLIGLLAGMFPAFVLANLKILRVLKGKLSGLSHGRNLRRVLVVVQFIGTLAILVGTIVVYQQMNYIQQKDLGFEEEKLLVIDINSRTAREKFEVFKDELQKHPAISEVATSSRVPGEWKFINEVTLMPQGNRSDSLESLFFCFDEHALSTFGMSIVDGENFRGNIASDSSSILINETAANALGLSSAVGSQIFLNGVPYPMTIRGVVKDFHVKSLHHEIDPIVIGYWANPITRMDYFSCRFKGNNEAEVIAYAEEVQARLDPETPLEYHFLDQQIARFYEEDERVSKIFTFTTFLTILVACMGLFGLIAYSLAQRTKEVGIRKIMGASGSQLWYLLSKEVLLLIVVSLVLTIPLSWWGVSNWLDRFTFSIDIRWWVYLLAGILALVIAMLSVGYHISQAVRRNPVEAIRYE